MRRAPLGDHMVRRAGTVTPSQFPDEIFDLYSIPAHDANGFETIQGSAIGSAKQQVLPGDVMVSKIVPHIRRARVVGAPTGRRQIASGEWIVFRSQMLVPDYLRHYLVSDMFHQEFMATVAGVGGSLLRARPAQVAQIEVPVPSLDEQRRIAGILDQADALRAKRRKTLALIDDLTRAAFLDMFGHPMRDRRWEPVSLGSLARIVRGASPRPAGDPRYFGGAIPWLKISDITSSPGRVLHSIREGVTSEGMAKSVFLRRGTLILTNSATVAVPKVLGLDCCIHDGFLAFLELVPEVNQSWLYAALLVSRPDLTALAPEGTQKNLNGPIVKAVKMALPPRTMQVEFEQRLLRLEASERVVRTALVESQSLFKSLQDAVFSGRL